MEFSFPLRRHLPCGGGNIHIVDSSDLHLDELSHGVTEGIHEIIDSMGAASAKAQKLGAVITSVEKLQNRKHRMYFMADLEANDGMGKCLGFLRVGVIPNLWVISNMGKQEQRQTLCVLDFYVHETCQRRGYGRQIFDAMLQDQGVAPGKLAYDRPSPKLLGFLGIHYNLTEPRKQPNSFVIYQSHFFDDRSVISGCGGVSDQKARPWSPATLHRTTAGRSTAGESSTRYAPWATEDPHPPRHISSIASSSSISGHRSGMSRHSQRGRVKLVTPPSLPKVTSHNTGTFSRHLVEARIREPRQNGHILRSKSAIVSSDFVSRLQTDWGNQSRF